MHRLFLYSTLAVAVIGSAVGIKCFVGEYIGVSLPVAIPNLVKPKSKNCSSMYNSCFTITMNKTFDLKIYTKDLELRMGICGNDVAGCQVNCTKYTSSNCEVSCCKEDNCNEKLFSISNGNMITGILFSHVVAGVCLMFIIFNQF